MAYIENKEIKKPYSKNWEIKTQIHEKSTKEQRNQNQPRPKRNQLKNREIKTNLDPWEIKPKNTQRNQNPKHKPQTTSQNYRNKIAQISPTNPRFMRRKGIEH